MPSGPKKWHDYWTGYGPSEDGSYNAQRYLETNGWVLTRGWEWIAPTPCHFDLPRERFAIAYLIHEWDYGGWHQPTVTHELAQYIAPELEAQTEMLDTPEYGARETDFHTMRDTSWHA